MDFYCVEIRTCGENRKRRTRKTNTMGCSTSSEVNENMPDMGMCFVCEHPITDTCRLMVLVRCAHIFHQRCIQWAMSDLERPRCPTCNVGICPVGGLDVLDICDAKWMVSFSDEDRRKIIHTRSRLSKSI